MPPTLPGETPDLFALARVAAAYASPRPCLHPEVLSRIRDLIGAEGRFRCGLDVGCGTGLSSAALLGLAQAGDQPTTAVRRADRLARLSARGGA